MIVVSLSVFLSRSNRSCPSLRVQKYVSGCNHVYRVRSNIGSPLFHASVCFACFSFLAATIFVGYTFKVNERQASLARRCAVLCFCVLHIAEGSARGTSWFSL
ncbi:hypothetical protein H112_07660 [Trichophyton rubrum D6]|uniref:Uncharacterized protein n=3 Tax=Trichophyton TaxID=5550 RepID=A0A087PFJ8_TRIRC|nr:uncharacterized protein TERG_11531 [Trichophyton rubrum CBS 118892]EZF11245.1 hypothetical protein H100_07685 [Trichophyton rubrum MR850]EZF38110.1 hypothetical protein H102_07650 [Trichophyton rubrum CBS 100081]EZF48749.1 hypothetical protein H103_07673 [Trichophyton rubrum CBS 288.86]EZF59447.1 hypothetical protein H104_07621 [Trichophyton rubrum CBS 289.86]EZF69987.1 hypothetical protein H105_07676 [Trichophyton soudanense CBS 452.61]EZF80681.1 hypothetical protein H110_07670 [Trichophy